MCKLVKKIWSNPHDIYSINKTDISLIPKVDQPHNIKQFHLISLCNAIYKVVSKIMVDRLKLCISKIVLSYQTCFVPGRNIHENLL